MTMRTHLNQVARRLRRKMTLPSPPRCQKCMTRFMREYLATHCPHCNRPYALTPPTPAP